MFPYYWKKQREVCMKDFDAILFDMDGVLVNSEPVITEAAILGLREFGVQAAWEDFHAFTGMGEDRFVGGVAELHGVPYRVEMKRRVYEIYLQIVKEKIEVYEGTVPMLRRLNAAGLLCRSDQGEGKPASRRH
jgi:cytidine deaminase